MKKIAICLSLLISQAWPLTCSTPVTLSESGRHVAPRKVAINEEGEAITLWISKNPEKKERTLFAATRDGEKKWSIAALSEPVRDLYFCDQFIDDQGHQFAYWAVEKENDEGESKYYQFAKKPKNQAWSPAVTMSGPEDKLKYPKFTFDAQGNGLLLGHIEVEESPDVWTTYKVASHLYSHQTGKLKKTEIAKTGGYGNSQQVLRSRTGKIFACWEDSRTYHDKIKGYQSEKLLIGSWFQEEGSWSAPTTLFSFSDSPSLFDTKGAINSWGDLAMLCQTSASGHGKTIQAATCFDGQWSDPVELSFSDNYFQNLALKMNDEGHLIASWMRTEKGIEIIYAAVKPVGQPWSSSIALSDPTKDAHSSKMSIDDQGNILIVWITKEGRKKVPYAAYKPVNQEWAAPVSLSGGAQGCGHIKVETNHQGHFVVLWNELQKKQFSIHGAALSTATKEWTSATISPPGPDCGNFKFAFNKKGQGIITWATTWDNEDFYVQVAELNVN